MIGLIARAEDRGLGIQTWEFARHLNPEILLLDLGKRGTHLNRYPDATVVKYTGTMNERVVRRWLTKVDSVYTAETTYSPSFAEWARDAGTEVVVHVNPEFHREWNGATRWWAPTGWRLDQLPASTTVVPVPVATDRFTPARPHQGRTRWLHIAGLAALADRNGTEAVMAAIPHLRERCTLTVATQSALRFGYTENPLVDVKFVNGHDDYWSIYEGHDALVMPRRYGGLCLPVQEAMASGMAVLMSACSPNPQTWPVATVTATHTRKARMPVGMVPVADIDPIELARRMDELSDPHARIDRQAQSTEWAAAHSWDVWADRYRDLMGVMV